MFGLVPLGDFFVHNRISKEFSGADGNWKKVGDISYMFGAMKVAAYVTGMLY